MVEETHPISLYWFIGSQPSRAVKSILLAGNVPHNEVVVNLLKQE